MAERNYDFTEIKTRIIIRNDSAENWAGSEVILEKGEPAIEYDAVNKTAKIKFGDGTSTFSELPFSTLTPTEINSVIGNISSSVSGMQFKGTVGTSGTVTDISSIQSPQNGDTYKIITGITLTSEQSLDGNEHELTVGDIIICSSDKWVFVPSGNEDITSIKIAGSSDTINVSTTAQTGEVVLGTAAGVNTVSTVTDSATTVPTSSAVKTYVDTLENSLGTAATTDATAYATAAQGTLADNAMPKSGGTFTGDVTVSGELFTNNINASTSGTITIGTSDVIEEEWTSTSQTKIVFCNSNDDKYNNGTATQAKINVDYEDTYGPYGNEHSSSISLSSDYFSIHANKIEFRYPPFIYDGYGPGMNGVEGIGVPATTASREYVQQTAMLKSGGTFTGAITLPGAPTTDLQAATKKYVDDSVSSISTDSLIDGENILILNGGSATE